MNSPSGLLLVDKPSGPTSHDIVDHVRSLLETRAVGHAGTLDPFASGLLILGVGAGTKALTNLVGLDKTYIAQLRLGARTDTYDRTGMVIDTGHKNGPIPSEEAILRALSLFIGRQTQQAPLFSAKKRNGKKLYELARTGLATEEMRPKKEITISELELIAYTWPLLTIRTRVSSGTYIRTLGEEVGLALGVGAYVTELRRTSIGRYSVDHALRLDTATPEEAVRHLLSLDTREET